MLQINHVLINQDQEEAFAEINLQVSLKEEWQNEKGELLHEMLEQKLAQQIQDHLNVIYDNASIMLVEEFEAKLTLKTVKYLDRMQGCETVEEFISIVKEVLVDDYTGLDPLLIDRSLTPILRDRIKDCGSTLCRILEDHYSDPSYDLDVLCEHRKD